MRLIPTLFACVLAAAVAAAAPAHADDTYSQDEIMAKAKGFFGSTTKGLAEAIQKVFADKGQPNAVILGEEASGAIGIGLRYGEGMLERKAGGSHKVYWQGPSIGFDFAGIGINYQQAGKVILAPIRTGVGLRAGASVGYLHYSKQHSWIPF
mgnify:CR=1 FL=1